jgi:hypothetical protein
MVKKQNKVHTVDTSIEKLDKWLIKNGYKPTTPAHKEGTFVHISNKSKNK